MTNVSSTQNRRDLGGRIKGFPLKMLHVQVGNYKADWWSYGCSFNLFIEFILERDVCIVQAELQKFNMFCIDNTDMTHNVSSSSNRSSIMLRAGSMGTEVNSAEILYELRHSPATKVTSLTLLTKSLVLCMWCGDLPPSKGFSHAIGD